MQLKKYILVVLISFMGLGYLRAQDLFVPKTDLEYKNMTEAKMFVEAQEFSLKRIETEFSDLRYAVQNSRYLFTSAFGKAQRRINEFLKSNLNEVQFIEFNKNIENQINESINNLTLDKTSAETFISVVQNRAKGSITPENILRTLLIYQYFDNPSK